MSIARAIAAVGSLYALLRNNLGLNVETTLGEQEISVTVAPDRRLVVLGHEPVAGFAVDHGAVADEAAMLALHTLDSTTLLTEPTFVAPGDSCLRTDDPGWRWHCITGNGTQISDWERRPLAGALSGLAVSGHTHAISAVSGLQTALDGKQATLANAAVLARITAAAGGPPKWDGGDWPGGSSTGARDALIAALAPIAWYRADAAVLDADGNACTDGVAGATWQDQSGNGYHLTSTAGARPTLETGERNGLPVVRFDGVDDYMLASGFPSIDLTNVTVFSVFQQRTNTLERGVFVIGASGSGSGWGSSQRIYGATSAANLVWGAVANETVAVLSGSGPTPWGVWTHRVSGGSVTAGRNGLESSTVTGASMSASLTGLLVGGYWISGATTVGDLDFAEFIVVPQALPDATIALVASLLRAKWGI